MLYFPVPLLISLLLVLLIDGPDPASSHHRSRFEAKICSLTTECSMSPKTMKWRKKVRTKVCIYFANVDNDNNIMPRRTLTSEPKSWGSLVSLACLPATPCKFSLAHARRHWNYAIRGERARSLAPSVAHGFGAQPSNMLSVGIQNKQASSNSKLMVM